MLSRTALSARAFRAACRPQFVAAQSPALTSVRRYAAPAEHPIKLEHDQAVEGYWRAKGLLPEVKVESVKEFTDPAKEDPDMVQRQLEHPRMTTEHQLIMHLERWLHQPHPPEAHLP